MRKRMPPGNNEPISTEHAYVTGSQPARPYPSHNLTRNGQTIPRSGLDRHAAGMVRQPTSDSVFRQCALGQQLWCRQELHLPQLNLPYAPHLLPRQEIANSSHPALSVLQLLDTTDSGSSLLYGLAGFRKACSPRSSVKPTAAKILVLIPNALSAGPRSASGTLFSAVPSPPSSISSRHTVLRN